MLKIIQIISANKPHTAMYRGEQEDMQACEVVAYALTEQDGILPVVAWGECGAVDVLDTKTGEILLPCDYATGDL